MSLKKHWSLDPSVAFLNHGSFGACPIAVLAQQSELRARLEREPVQFFLRQLEPLLDAARGALARFVGAEPDDLAFVPNATTGANTVVRSIEWKPGDELLTTDHAYNACKNALEYAATRGGAKVTVAKVPFPLRDPREVTDAILAAATPRTRLALIDHVTSQTALVFPVKEIVAGLAARGIDTLVDGAHAPGMVPLDLSAIGAAYYTGNCHKWLCAPKGAAFLWVRRDRQALIRPLTISHGANSTRTDRSRFRLEFDWGGTDDPTAFLCVPASIDFLGSLLPGGWPALTEANHRAAVEAQKLLCEALSIPTPCPPPMLGSMTSVPVSDGPAGSVLEANDPLQRMLFDEHGIEVPVFPWPAPPKRLLRVAMQAYVGMDEVAKLASVLRRAQGAARA